MRWHRLQKTVRYWFKSQVIALSPGLYWRLHEWKHGLKEAELAVLPFLGDAGKTLRWMRGQILESIHGTLQGIIVVVMRLNQSLTLRQFYDAAFEAENPRLSFMKLRSLTERIAPYCAYR
jgi:hypothetical protein